MPTSPDHDAFHARVLARLASDYPRAAASLDLKARFSRLLLCPEPIRLSKDLKIQAESIVRAFFALRQMPERRARLADELPPVSDPHHFAALMSYDFHVDTDGRLRLIEINTNASMSLLVDLAHRVHGLPNPFVGDFRQDIVACFNEEARLALGRAPAAAAITDDDPANQRLYVEFEMFRELLSSSGLPTEIVDTRHFGVSGGALVHGSTKIDLVYNRNTDFYLQSPDSAALLEANDSRIACVTPGPYEYRLLADKSRLIELSGDGAIDDLALTDEAKRAIGATLIRTRHVRDFPDTDTLWRERKKWFFKPARSYGGRAAYRGSSITKPVFADVVAGDYLAQEFVPAPKIATSVGPLKYDLRFYAYRDRIQLACARLYEGQMTNSQTEGGGAAVIEWT